MQKNNDVMDLVDRILAVKTAEEAHQSLASLRDYLGLEHFLYAVKVPEQFCAAGSMAITNYQHEWLARYTREDYLRIDPVVRHCTTSLLPYSWDKMRESASSDPVLAKFAKEAHDFGLARGVSVGLQGRAGEQAILSVATASEGGAAMDDLRRAIPLVHTILPYIHEALHHLTADISGTSTSEITDRERECLLWSAEGETAQEIGDRLLISHTTVTFHLQNVMRKLGARNRYQALARAVLLGIIQPQLLTPTLKVPNNHPRKPRFCGI